MHKQAGTEPRKEIVYIAIFASGTGTNAQKIIDFFKTSNSIHVKLIVCNRPLAKVLEIARVENISALLIEKDLFFSEAGYTLQLQQYNISFIVLAGFLWKIPASIIKAYPFKIVNIHPALLPAHSGKNMYGDKVHEAVIASGDKVSGITIHYVDGEYDHGDIIFQKKCEISENETVDTLKKKIHALEHENYPRIIEEVIQKQLGL